MNKINIINSQNLTLLAKAYMNNLITKAKLGEVFYEKNKRTGEIEFIYFNEDYYSNILVTEINNPLFISKINSSNAAIEWNDLRNCLLDSSEVEIGDLSVLELYTITDKPDNPLQFSDNLLQIILSKEINYDERPWSRIENDLKRLVPSLNADVFSSDGLLRVSFTIPINQEKKDYIDLLPVTKLIIKNGCTITNITFFKDINADKIFTRIFFITE